MASNKSFSATVTLGGAVAGSFTSAINSTKAKLGEVGKAIKQLDREQEMLTQGIRTLGREGKNVDRLRDRYNSAAAAADRLRNATARLQSVEAARERNAAARQDIKGQLGSTVGQTMALGATVAAPIVQAAQFQKAMIGVSKQVQGARDSNGQLTSTYYDMAESIQSLGREMPIATNDIADMVTAAARMGIEGKQNILDFVKLSGQMSVAFEAPAAELADQMGKIANVTGIPIAKIGDLADTINYLDDNAISKGSDIINVLQRIGGTAKQIGMSAKDAAALGSTFLSLGSSAEVAATASNAMIRELAIAESQPKRFQKGLEALKLNAKSIQKDMAKDATGTILKVLDALNKLPQEQQVTVATQLFGKEYGDDAAKLAGSVQEYRRQLELANSEAAKGSMGREYAAQLTLVTAQWAIAKNRVTELSVAIGTALLPAVNDTLTTVGPTVTAIATWAKENPKVTQGVIALAGALVVSRFATLGAALGMNVLRGATLGMARVVAGARVEMALSAIAVRGYGLAAGAAQGGILGMAQRSLPILGTAIRSVTAALLTNPIGLIAAGIAAAGLLVYKNWDVVKAFFEGFGEGVRQGLEPITTAFAGMLDSMPVVKSLFEGVGGAVQTVVGWFGSLLEPVKYSNDELGRAAGAGVSFGQTVGAALALVWTPLEKIIQGITWIANNAGSAISAVSNFTSAAGEKIGNGARAVKDFFGMGSSTPDGASAAPGSANGAPGMASPGVPSIPAPAGAAGGGKTITDNSTTTINLTQRAGESNQDLAKRTVDEMERRKAINQRNAMYDGASQP